MQHLAASSVAPAQVLCWGGYLSTAELLATSKGTATRAHGPTMLNIGVLCWATRSGCPYLSFTRGFPQKKKNRNYSWYVRFPGGAPPSRALWAPQVARPCAFLLAPFCPANARAPVPAASSAAGPPILGSWSAASCDPVLCNQIQRCPLSSRRPPPSPQLPR